MTINRGHDFKNMAYATHPIMIMRGNKIQAIIIMKDCAT